MCGICGIFEFQDRRTVPEDLVRRMSDTIVHRGPDDEGIYVGEGIGLGFRRLSIIDLSGGHQPIANEDGSIWVMLNGEIYNYPELRKDLISRGHHFRTRSDTESIVHLYEEYGEDCFRRLRGMFAIALWDSRGRKLLLARDRVGKKPLFYAADPKRILFGSELKALLAADGIPRGIDQQALADYFSFGYVPAPKTIYSAVKKVLPGHYLAVTEQQVRDVSYWDLSFGAVENRSEEEWCELLRGSICEATRVRLMSDVPLGAFLSGGVDSSSIVATMTRLMSRPVTTCSIGFEDKEYNETGFARQIADQFHSEHHEEIVRPSALDVLDKLVWHYDEPFADSSAIPTYYVSKVARQHVTVALGGDGGDEGFAGYRRYMLDYFENRLRRFVPPQIRSSVFGPLGKWYPGLAWAPRVFRGKATFQSLSRTPLEGYFNSISYFRPDEKQQLFTADFRRSLGQYDSLEVLQQYYDRAGTTDLLSRIQYVDIKTYLTDDILAKVDRASMAVSLEVRAPLLDHQLLELAARIPSSLKLRGRTGKYIFKKAMASELPDGILNRKKMGFAIPLARWFREELRDLTQSILFDSADGILNPAFLNKIWEQHQRGQYDRSQHLWAVLMFRKWKSAFAA
ncbi:MAG TPA: XrtA/PEP-CTERM system amidotransferase [Candidatus Acidoferrales bacterium]|nr:XrtA/PEP-CTERM system amidotransferase [Candidatus Acidoferrales bacterium]